MCYEKLNQTRFYMSIFPNNVKISLDSRSCKPETFSRPKEISPDSRWSMADSHLLRLKNDQKTTKKTKTDQKNNWIVRQMWLGILPYLPLFYQTCPVDSTLLGKTDMCITNMESVHVNIQISLRQPSWIHK